MTAPPQLLLKKLHPEAQLPTRAYPTSVGLDIKAFLISESGKEGSALIPPATVKAIPTGLLFGGVVIPGRPVPGQPPNIVYNDDTRAFVQVCSRSGLAADSSIFVANAPGIVDPEYRGEIKILLYNGGHSSCYVRHNQRIAQLVVTSYLLPSCIEVDELSETKRGEKGFGSTGS